MEEGNPDKKKSLFKGCWDALLGNNQSCDLKTAKRLSAKISHLALVTLDRFGLILTASSFQSGLQHYKERAF